MRVTGIIICRNSGERVVDSLTSFYKQDYEPKELVVVDNGSVDNSWDIIKSYEYEGRKPTIFGLDQPQGTAFAKQLAIEQSWDNTDIFAFMDGEAVYEQGYISKAVSLLREQYGHPGIVYCDQLVTDVVRHLEYYRPFSSFSPEALKKRRVAESNLIVSKAVFKTVSCGDVLDDFDLMLRASRSFMVLHIPEPLVRVKYVKKA